MQLLVHKEEVLNHRIVDACQTIHNCFGDSEHMPLFMMRRVE
jgi:hypothetical protein